MPSVFEQVLDPANRADPYPLYRQLRTTPVTREPDGSYVVSHYRDIVALLHDPRVSSRDALTLRGFISTDPPEHDRLRALMNRHYGPPATPARIARMAPDLLAVVTGLIDGFTGRTGVDLVDDFAYPLPVTAICRLLGVPLDDEPRFHTWADAIVEGIGPQATDDARRRADIAFADLARYFTGLLDTHRHTPGDDLLSAIITDPDVRDAMSPDELLANASLLLIAGHETTVNLITNGMLTLLRHPAALERVRHDPDFVILTVEELLRFEPPVHILVRRALDDVDLDGTTIPAGATIRLVLAAGSRDPDHVPDPDRFDPDRHDPRRPDFNARQSEHLGFGGGVHHCFGAPLARLETQIALTELARRLRNPRLRTDPPPYRPNPVLRGPRNLPVVFDGIAPATAED
ncbi:cytochrome P450 [Dactylosporangium aurantiacum]|uniref:Cytochrome P450 n=1 Tax=Dactylosporangium aurantiacum TaxID=35754 RepID=A0A9Q9MG18_9ACTN|nr:cytochrome P450 [Dactylosporangium aurantiacum]MDG6107330.1 cytochrome P450 [Dactylosporangium aurantiacum]UWZ51146.1 cytochrome P450 [Dactylosporangium aurantiacum]